MDPILDKILAAYAAGKTPQDIIADPEMGKAVGFDLNKAKRAKAYWYAKSVAKEPEEALNEIYPEYSAPKPIPAKKPGIGVLAITPKEAGAKHKATVSEMDIDGLFEFDKQQRATFDSLKNTGSNTERWRARMDERNYSQDAPAKIADIVTKRDALSDSDWQYVKTTAPKIAAQLANHYAPQTKGKTDAPGLVNMIRTGAKKEKDDAIKQFGETKKKSIAENLTQWVGEVDMNRAIADPDYLQQIRQGVTEKHKQNINQAKIEIERKTGNNAGMAFGANPMVMGAVKMMEYESSHRKAIESEFTQATQQLDLLEAYQLRLRMPNASPQEIGRMVMEKNNPDAKLAKGGSRKVNREAEMLGLQADMLTGEQDRVMAAEEQMQTIDDRHPDEKINTIMHKLSAEHNRDNTVWENIGKRNANLKETDKYANQFNSTDKAFYYKHVRPILENEENNNIGGIMSLPSQDLAGRAAVSFMGTATELLKFGAKYLGIYDKQARAIDRLDSQYTAMLQNVGEAPVLMQQFEQLAQKEKEGTFTPEDKVKFAELKQYVDTRKGYEKFIGFAGDTIAQAYMFGTLGRVVGGAVSGTTNAGLRIAGLAPTAVKAGKVAGAAGIAENMMAGIGVKMGKSTADAIGLITAGYTISLPSRLAESEAMFEGKEGAAWKTPLYANTMALLEGVSELVIRDTRYIDMFNKQVSSGLAELVQAMGKKGVTRSTFNSQLKGVLKGAWNTTLNAGMSATGEVTEELIIEWADFIEKSLLAPEYADIAQTIENSKDVAIATGLGFAPMSIYGAYRTGRRKSADFLIPQLAQIGRDATLTNSLIRHVQDNTGTLYTPDEAKDKLSSIAHIQQVNKELTNIDLSALDLKAKKLDKWVMMAANERVLYQKSEATTDPVIKAQILKEIKESQDGRNKLVNNQLIVNDDMDLQATEEILEQAKQEQQAVTGNVTAPAAQVEADPELVAAIEADLAATGQATKIVTIPIKELTTDTKSFQGRSAEYSRDTAASVVGEFDSTVWNPIVFWTNEKGEKVVLAGHSRKVGLQILTKIANNEQLSEDEQSVVRMARENTGLTETEMVENAKANGFVPGMVPEAKEHTGTFQSAKDVALKSNSRGTVQTPWENAKIVAKKRSEGASPAQMKKELRQVSNRGEMAYTEALSYLNPGGKAAAILTEQDKDPEKASENVRQTVRRAALTAGKMRKAYPQLQSIHEDEIFEAVMDGSVTMDEVAERVDMAVNNPEEPFDADKAINIKQKKFLSAAAQAWYNKLKELESEKARLKKLLQKDPGSGRTGVETEFFEQQQAIGKTATEALDNLNSDRGKEIVKQRTTETKAGLARKEDEILLHEKGKEQLSKARQGSLFMAGQRGQAGQKEVRLNPDKADKDFYGQDIDKLDPKGKRAQKIILSLNKLFNGTKYFQGFVFADENNFAQAVDDQAKGDESRMYRNLQGNVYGFESNGLIFLNTKYFNANTPVHEASHVFTKWLAANNPTLHATMLRKASKSHWAERVRNNPNYQNASPEVIAEEALAWAVGAQGNRMSRSFKDDLVTMWQNIKDAILGVTIRNTDELAMYASGLQIERVTGRQARNQARAYHINIEGMEPFDIASLSFDEMATMVAARILKGSPLEVVKTGAKTEESGIVVLLPDNPELERMPFITVVGDVDMDNKEPDGGVSIVLPRPRGEELPTISLMAGGERVYEWEKGAAAVDLSRNNPDFERREKAADKFFLENTDKLVAGWVENHPKLIDPDEIRMVFGANEMGAMVKTPNPWKGLNKDLGYDGKWVDPYKLAGDKLVLAIRDWHFANNPNKTILAFTGNAGAGKGTTKKANPELFEKVGVLYDAALSSFTSLNGEVILPAIENGWDLTIIHVYNDPVTSLTTNAIGRALGSGRFVPLTYFYGGYAKNGGKAAQVIAKYPNLKYWINDNSFNQGNGKILQNAENALTWRYEITGDDFIKIFEYIEKGVTNGIETKKNGTNQRIRLEKHHVAAIIGDIRAVEGMEPFKSRRIELLSIIDRIESSLQANERSRGDGPAYGENEPLRLMAGRAKNQLALLFPNIENTNTRFDETETNKDSEPAVQYIKSSTGQSTPFKIYESERGGNATGANATNRPPYNLLPSDGYNEDEQGQFALVERQWTENKNFNFTGKTKIKTKSDVAWLFSSLEDESIEQLFAVFIMEDGSHVIQHVSSGSFDQTLADGRLIVGNATALGAKSVVIVHNHPSGNLYASKADQNMWLRLRILLKPANIELLDGIIINLRTGRYGYFNNTDMDQDYKSDSGKGKTNIPTYSFSKQFFVNNYNPVQARSPNAFAKLINGYKFGLNDRIELLISNNALYVTAKILLDLNKPLYSQVNTLIAKYGGVRGILVGNVPYDKIKGELSDLIKGTKGSDIGMMHEDPKDKFYKLSFSIDDYILVKSHNAQTGNLNYLSLQEDGTFANEPTANFMSGTNIEQKRIREQLELERDAEIAEAEKPKMPKMPELDFIDNTNPELNKPTGKERIVVSKRGRTTTKPETYRDLQNDIKKSKAILESILKDCL